jgi:segregation and condensation protein B
MSDELGEADAVLMTAVESADAEAAVSVGDPAAVDPAAVDPAAVDPAGEDDAAEDDASLWATPEQLVAAVEAVLFVVEAPVTVTALASALKRPTAEITDALHTLTDSLVERGSGIELRDVAGGVRLYTRPELDAAVSAFLLDGQRTRLTQAALETLAVVAYRQPVTRARISAIRGVNVDGVIRTLTTRGLIVEVGTDPDTGGGLYRTSELFLERLGLESLEQLPSLAPLLPELDGLESDELSS